ncbi:MAG: hypothetical protein ACYST6_09020 [Planctomycetota bacterium]|jgi:hypothetical protein
MNDPQELLILQDLTGVLDSLHIPYAIGGSMASSIYGTVRFTQDADITVEPFDNVAGMLFEILGGRYYLSREAMFEALKRRTSFNVIHLASAFKIDVFVSKGTPFEKELMLRRKQLRLSESIEKSFSVVSPEDIILLKLRWYLDGGSTSDRQWADVLDVLTVQAEKLDLRYLKKWGVSLRVNELLEKAIAQTKEFL